MNRRLSGFSVAFALVVGSATVLAASSTPTVKPGGRAQPRNPYRGLFQPTPAKPADQASASQQAQSSKPKVVCGMTIIPADPTIDPKFTLAPPDRSTKFTMRVVEPTICKP